MINDHAVIDTASLPSIKPFSTRGNHSEVSKLHHSLTRYKPLSPFLKLSTEGTRDVTVCLSFCPLTLKI